MENKFIEELYKEQYNFFFNVANKILNNRNDAEDAVSEAFFKIKKNMEKIFEISCHERLPYCVKIVKTCSYNIIRKRKTLKEEGHLTDDMESDSKDMLQEIIEKQSVEELAEILCELSSLEMEIIKQRYFRKN